MAFAIMPCSYCGGATEPYDDGSDICQSCGKRIYKSRSDLMTFARAVEREEDFGPIIDMISDDNVPKALTTINTILEENPEDRDAYFIRGLVWSKMGEDGKALIDWKKGLELMDTFYKIDAYVCLIGRSISDLILYKEQEFITFEQIKFIDRVGEILYECTGDSCRMILYYTIFKIYTQTLDSMEIGCDDSLFLDIVPGMFRRIIEYCRNYPVLIGFIDGFLSRMEYSDETYEEDDNYECHLYNLVRLYIEAYTKDFNEEDVDRIMVHWNDSNMKELADQFEMIASCVVDPSMFNKFKLLRSTGDDKCEDITYAVNDYVKTYLALDGDPSDIVKMLQ